MRKLTHGWAGYKRGCRCDVCREANRLVVTRYRARLRDRQKAA